MDAITFQKLKEIEARHHALEAEMLHLASTSGPPRRPPTSARW
jgi:hypothetical protein